MNPVDMAPGDRIVVRTPDRREYCGRLLELRDTPRNAQALVRLDSGWETSYPVHMVHRAPAPPDAPGSQS
jgi:hypothetical protein